jgi:hypothetical protein
MFSTVKKSNSASGVIPRIEKIIVRPRFHKTHHSNTASGNTFLGRIPFKFQPSWFQSATIDATAAEKAIPHKKRVEVTTIQGGSALREKFKYGNGFLEQRTE